MIWHYTLRPNALDITREGVIRTLPVLVYLDLMARQSRELEPAVWLTTADGLDGPIRVKGHLAGLSPERSGNFWRFGVDDAFAPLDLPGWAEKHGHQPELFRWMILTGHLAGSNYEDWRMAEVSIPAEQWITIEYLEAGVWHPGR